MAANAFQAAFGTTIMKRAFGLAVVRLDGTRAGFREALVRTLLRIVEVNPLLFGGLPAGLSIAFTKRRQRLGDILAGTAVVRIKEVPATLGAAGK